MLSAGLLVNLHRNFDPPDDGHPRKNKKKLSKNLIVPKWNGTTRSLFIHIAKPSNLFYYLAVHHSRSNYYLITLPSDFDQDQKVFGHQSESITKKPLVLVSQSKFIITSPKKPESCRLWGKTLLGSRLLSGIYRLSYCLGSSTLVTSANTYHCDFWHHFFKIVLHLVFKCLLRTRLSFQDFKWPYTIKKTLFQ